jgi:hypothetical protein
MEGWASLRSCKDDAEGRRSGDDTPLRLSDATVYATRRGA